MLTQLECHPFVGLLDLVLSGIFVHSQDLVVVHALGLLQLNLGVLQQLPQLRGVRSKRLDLQLQSLSEHDKLSETYPMQCCNIHTLD